MWFLIFIVTFFVVHTIINILLTLLTKYNNDKDSSYLYSIIGIVVFSLGIFIYSVVRLDGVAVFIGAIVGSCTGYYHNKIIKKTIQFKKQKIDHKKYKNKTQEEYDKEQLTKQAKNAEYTEIKNYKPANEVDNEATNEADKSQTKHIKKFEYQRDNPISMLDSDYTYYEYLSSVIHLIGYRDAEYIIPSEILKKLKANIHDISVYTRLRDDCDFKVDGIKDLVKNILLYLGIPYITNDNDISVDIVDKDKIKTDSNSEHMAGGYQTSGNFNNNRIKIILSIYSDFDSVISTVCHECTHAYCDFLNIKYGTLEQNEKFTDIVAIWLGFYGVMHAGYKQRKTLDGYSKLGYIEYDDMYRCYQEFERYKSVYEKDLEYKQLEQNERNNAKVKKIKYLEELINTTQSNYDKLVSRLNQIKISNLDDVKFHYVQATFRIIETNEFLDKLKTIKHNISSFNKIENNKFQQIEESIESVAALNDKISSHIFLIE